MAYTSLRNKGPFSGINTQCMCMGMNQKGLEIKSYIDKRMISDSVFLWALILGFENDFEIDVYVILI